MSLAEYNATPDAVLVDAFFAPRDDDGHLVPLWRRRRDADDEGRPAAFPSREELEIPEEAFEEARPGMTTGFILMVWQVGRERGWTTEQILKAQREA